MIKLSEVTLESEMDVVLSGQKFSKITELLPLSLSAKSTFASAISEVIRVITDHTDAGLLQIGLKEMDGRFKLVGLVSYPVSEERIDIYQFHYAKKLVPVFEFSLTDDVFTVEFSIGLPKSLNLSKGKVTAMARTIEASGPLSPYEILKISKNNLALKSRLQKEELVAVKFLNDMKSEFISMASHELKTPITILKAYGQLALSEKITSVEQVQTIVRKMNAQSGKLSQLALQLLDSAKIEVGQLEYQMDCSDFNPFLIKMIEDLKHLIPDHAIETDLCESRMVNFDPLRMEQVVSNLLSNAGKYSAKGSRVLVKTNLKDSDQLLILSITDQGIGISSVGIAKIFEKFYREPEVMSKHSGLGMGMYIASKIVHAHGGQIWVESEYGNGSTFFVSLPIEI